MQAGQACDVDRRERKSRMTLDDYQKIAQIGFYATVAVISILTFIKAKRGLLNTVNTEYHKKVIERLDDLSKTLFDEYDPDSEHYWAKTKLVDEAIDEINKEYLEYKDEILKAGEFFSGIRTCPTYERLSKLVKRVKSDPFIPKTIRDTVVDLLENRVDVLMDAYLTEIEEYQDALAKGNYKGDLDNSKHLIHNRIIDTLNEKGCGIAQIEEEVHKVRLAIQDYFEKFRP